MAQQCEVCGSVIPQARLEALSDATTCVGCSDTAKVTGLMVWSHKTAPEIVIARDAELLRPYDRRGFHASLPLGSYKNPRLKVPETQNLSQQIRLERPGEDEQLEVATATPARCHPDRPRINPRGDCLPCALALQARRVK